jgi:hypothetical protein
MKRIAPLLLLLGLTIPIYAAPEVSIAQLENYLAAARGAKESDAAIADRLSQVTLNEQLTDGTLSQLLAGTVPGPRTLDQLQILAAASIFHAPPISELPKDPAPDQFVQHQLMSSASKYVNGVLHLLPDFLATRATIGFNNTPGPPDAKRSPPKARLHFVRDYHREIAYRHGSEVEEVVPAHAGAKGGRTYNPSGLTTWGEFGPILTLVLSDSLKGSVVWNRWQTSKSGGQMAVFRYAVPLSDSHYAIDFCCYSPKPDDPPVTPFRVKPAYHGEIFIEPVTGAIVRFTLEAELSDDDPITAAGIAVDYGRVEIGGREYMCPVRGVAISEIHNFMMESVDKVGQERDINLVRFINYHKFASDARIVSPVADEPER